MPHKNILIAIDSSEEAREVVAAAKDLAGDSGASLSLITVVKPFAYAYGAEYSLSAAPMVNIEQEAADFAGKNQSALEAEFAIECGKAVVIGQPSGEIRRYAEETGADLIVIGSHGRHGLGLLLGSTANGVLHGAPCDVFVVRIKNTG